METHCFKVNGLKQLEDDNMICWDNTMQAFAWFPIKYIVCFNSLNTSFHSDWAIYIIHAYVRFKGLRQKKVGLEGDTIVLKPKVEETI